MGCAVRCASKAVGIVHLVVFGRAPRRLRGKGRQELRFAPVHGCGPRRLRFDGRVSVRPRRK
eukprot:4145487-Lingulodinium_polyedra.AAC.1